MYEIPCSKCGEIVERSKYRKDAVCFKCKSDRINGYREQKLTIKVKEKKLKCRKCGRVNGTVKFYIVNSKDGVPKAYHPLCFKSLKK